jgi:hypothetical protein
MAQPLQSINLIAPGFKGVNTEDSPIAQDQSFADIADNAVIDKRGRIAARKGVVLLTTSGATELGTDHIHRIHEFFDDAGNVEIFSATNNKILKGTTTLTEVTPAAYTPTANNWKIVNFNDKAYFFQNNHEPLVYDNATGLRTFGTANGTTTPSYLYGSEAIAAYGRLWTVGGSDTQTIYWSDLLIGTSFTGGSSGSINVSKAWPDGSDEVVALAAHNNLLIIFGKHSILAYANAFSPAEMALADTVAGVGCIDRNSVQHIGTDVLFLSSSGVRSFGRAVQEKSLPLSDLSLNIKTELIEIVQLLTQPVQSVYSPENSFYLLTFPELSTTYCFDLKGTLENRAYRVTKWVSAPFKSFCQRKNGELLVGTLSGVGQYTGYSDLTESFRFRYYSPGLTFGDPSKLKMVKKLKPTIIGGNSSLVSVKWGYDFSTSYNTLDFGVGNQVPFYFNEATTQFGTSPDTGGTVFTEAEFTGGIITSRPTINTSGNGSIVTIGIEAEINGFPLSLQEINVLALIGRTL